MKLPVPEAVGSRLAELEAQPQAFDAMSLAASLDQLVPDVATLSEDEKRGCFAEVVAWRFMPTRSDSRVPWGIYFAPIFSGTTADGQQAHNPDAADITKPIIEHWTERAQSSNHPLIKARFGDLALEMGSVWSRDHPKDRIARQKALVELTIDAYLASVASGLCVDDHHAWRQLDRALELAVKVNDLTRIASALDAAFAYAREEAKKPKPSHWWNLHCTVWGVNGVTLSQAQTDELLGWLDDALDRHSDLKHPTEFDPHWATDAAEMLRLWHLKLKQPDLAIAAVKKAAQAFEAMASKADGLTAIAWLEDVSIKLKRDGLTQDAARVDATIRDRSGDAEAAMVRHGVTYEVPDEEVQRWLSHLTADSLDHTLQRISFEFVHDEAWLKQFVEDMASEAPLQAHMPISLIGPRGFRTAMVGSVADDLPGRMIFLASTLIGHQAGWLNVVLERTIEVWELDAQKLHAWLVQSPIFKTQEGGLLLQGLKAWEAADFAKAVHLLVPQVEAALRECMFAWGESPMVFDKETGGFESMGMGRMLNNEIVKKTMSPPLRHHLRCLYTHPKGLNLRNKIAHGWAGEELAGRGMANWAVHTLLALRCVHPLPASRGGVAHGGSCATFCAASDQ